jgi:hypothetical protein
VTRVWRDKDGDLWAEKADGTLLCVDDMLRRGHVRAVHLAQPLEHGPLEELLTAAELQRDPAHDFPVVRPESRMTYHSHSHVIGRDRTRTHDHEHVHLRGSESHDHHAEEAVAELTRDHDLMATRNQETFSEETLLKVSAGLAKAGVYCQQAANAISAMQNEGILFRERAGEAVADVLLYDIVDKEHR